MAQQRYQQQSTIQPTPPVSDPGTAQQVQGWRTLAATMDWYGAQIGTQLQQDALIKAEADAPQLLRYDGNGAVIAPDSFDAEGGGPTYRARFRAAGIEYYKMAAGQDFRAAADRAVAAFPNDPGAVAKQLSDQIDMSLRGLDPKVAPVMRPIYEASRAQAVSQAVAGRERANLQALTETTSREVNQFIIDAAKSGVAFDKIQGADPASVDATTKMMGERWATIESAMRKAGATDQVIANLRERTAVFVQARRIGDQLYGGLAGMSGTTAGEIQGAVARAQAQALEFSRKYGKYEGDVFNFLMANINQGAGYAQGLTAEDNEQRRKIVDEQAKKFIMLQNDNAGGTPEEAQRLDAGRRQIFADVLANPRLRDSDRLQLMGQLTGFRNPVVAQAYSSAAETMINGILSPDTPPMQRQSYAQQLTALSSDPGAVAAMGGAGVARMRDAVSTWRTADLFAQNVPAAVAAIEAGDVSPANMKILGNTWRQAGLLTPTGAQGSMSETQFAQLAVKGEAKYNEVTNARMMAGSALLNFQGNGTMPTGDAEDAVRKYAPVYKPKGTRPDGSQGDIPWDWRNPEHVQGALMDLYRFGIVNKDLKNWFATLSPQSSPEELKTATAMKRSFVDFYRKSFPGGLVGQEGYRMAEAWTEKQIGNLDMVRKYEYHGPEGKPSDYMRPLPGQQNNDSRNAGGAPPDEARAKLDAALTGQTQAGFARYGDTIDRTWNSLLDTTGLWGKDNLDPIMKRLLSRSGETNFVMPGTFSIDPATRQDLLDRAQAHLAEKGGQYSAAGLDPIRESLRFAFAQMEDTMGVTRGPQGEKMLMINPLEKIISDRTTVPVGRQGAIDYVVAQYVGADRLQQWAKGSESYVKRQEGGSTVYDMVARSNTSPNADLITIGTFDPNAPSAQPAFIEFRNRVIRDLDIPDAARLLNRAADGLFTPYLLRQSAETLAGIESGRLIGSPQWTSFVRGMGQYYGMMFGGEDAKLFDKLGDPEIARRLARYGALDWLSNPGAGLARYGPPPGPAYGPPRPIVPRPQAPAPGTSTGLKPFVDPRSMNAGDFFSLQTAGP